MSLIEIDNNFLLEGGGKVGAGVVQKFFHRIEPKNKNETHKLNPDHHFFPPFFHFRIFSPQFLNKIFKKYSRKYLVSSKN